MMVGVTLKFQLPKYDGVRFHKLLGGAVFGFEYYLFFWVLVPSVVGLI